MTIERITPTADETTLRNQDLRALAAMLRDQHARKVDFVAPAANIHAEDGMIAVTDVDATITEDGVTQVNGLYRPTATMIGGFASKLDVPVGYLKRIHHSRTDLFDANVNGLLHGRKAKTRARDGALELVRPAVPGDDRAFFVRTFQGDGGPGLGRALLSDKFKRIDNLDVLMTILEAIRAAGIAADVRSADLTDSRMYVRIYAEEIKAYATELLKGYRSPFTGATGDENPTVFAGFVVTNSEVGAGAFTITPQLVVQVCDNGMTITKDVLRRQHVGSRMEEGLIDWSDETRDKEMELIQLKTRDAVGTFLDTGYINRQIAILEQTAGKPISAADQVVRHVGKKLAFSEEQITGILEHFIRGGQHTAGGVMQAVTSYSQLIKDADDAAEVEAQGIKAMELAAAM